MHLNEKSNESLFHVLAKDPNDSDKLGILTMKFDDKGELLNHYMTEETAQFTIGSVTYSSKTS